MKIKKLYSIALASTALILLLILTLSAALSASPTITETQITTNESAQMEPAIYGDRIVWTDSRNGILDEYGNIENLDIYMYDLSTSREIQITTNESNQSRPAIYGDRIVWVDDRNGNHDLYMYDISDSKETRITTSGSVYCCIAPAIHGDRVVWTDMRNDKNGTNSDIYMYDLSTHKETPITDEPFLQWEPSIYGDRIVWADFRYGYNEGQSCIFMYDLSTSTETQITGAGSDHLSPAIYGDRIVYCNTEMGEIFMYDLSTHNETQITTTGLAGLPAIYGDRIVYWDMRNQAAEAPSNSDIYLYDLSTSREILITTNESEQFDPAIYGDRIVWSDTRNGYPKYDIYMCTISGNGQTLNPPVANFSASPTSGNAPLEVTFTDRSTGSPTSWNWVFGDGGYSTYRNPVHTYNKAGTYTVSLTASNEDGATSKTLEIIVREVKILPVADFSTNLSSGYVPLSVLFTDLSKNATSRSWDVNNDGIEDSNGTSFVYVYTSPGTYIANLSVSNTNGTASKTAVITALEKGSSNDDSSSGGGSSHSSGGSGGGGVSPEPARNVETKELSQAYITNGKAVKFDFTKNATCVVYVSFDAKKTAGKTTTIVEELKGKSALVSELPAGEVYKSFNVWVGNSGFSSSKSIENPALCFKVEKSWIQDNKIDEDSITLNRYSDIKWERLPANLSGEDNKFLYFTADVPGFSSFAITGNAKGLSGEDSTQPEPEQETRLAEGKGTEIIEPETGQNSEEGEDTKAPGFGLISGIICILCVFLCKISRK